MFNFKSDTYISDVTPTGPLNLDFQSERDEAQLTDLGNINTPQSNYDALAGNATANLSWHTLHETVLVQLNDFQQEAQLFRAKSWIVKAALGVGILTPPVLASFTTEPKGVAPEVTVAGQHCNATSYDELQRQVESIAKQGATRPILVVAGADEWHISPLNFSRGQRTQPEYLSLFRSDIAAAQAWMAGREHPWINRYLSPIPRAIALPVTLDEERIERQLRNWEGRQVPSVSPRLIWKGGSKFDVIKGRTGWHFRRPQAVEAIKRGISLAVAGQTGDAITLPRENRKSDITVQYLRSLRRVIGRNDVYVTSSVEAAHTNIRIATKAFSFLMLEPGRKYSANAIIGERRIERGYRKAKTFRENKVIEDTGGGVCVVSTSVFQCLRAAGIKIHKRFPHSRPVQYAKREDEAALAWGNKDLIFENTSKTRLALVVRMHNRRVQCLVVAPE